MGKRRNQHQSNIVRGAAELLRATYLDELPDQITRDNWRDTAVKMRQAADALVQQRDDLAKALEVLVEAIGEHRHTIEPAVKLLKHDITDHRLWAAVDKPAVKKALARAKGGSQ